MKMYGTIALLITLLIKCCTSEYIFPEVSDVGIVKPGIAFGFSDVFFNNFFKGLLPQLFLQLNNTIFKGGTVKLKVHELFDIYLKMIELQVSDIYYDLTDTRVDLISDNNTIGIHISNSGAHMNSSYKFYLDPLIMNDQGNLEAGYDHLSFDFICGFEQRTDDPRKPYIRVSLLDLDADLRDIYVNLTNSNELLQSIYNLINTLKPKYKGILDFAPSECYQKNEDSVSLNLKDCNSDVTLTKVKRFLKDSVAGYAEIAINSIIKEIPIPIVFNKNTALDITLVEPIQVIANYFAIGISGDFTPVGEDLPFNNTIDMPIFNEKGESLQVYISEYTFRSFTYTMQKLGYLTVTIDESIDPKIIVLDTNSFGYFIPPLVKHYGKGKKCRLTIYSLDENYPTIDIMPGKINGTTTANLDIDVYVEKDEFDKYWEHAVVLQMDAIFVGHVDIKKDLVVTIDISEIKFNLTKVVHSKVGKINTDMLNKLTIILSVVIKSTVNLIFSRGLPLSVFLGLDIDFGSVDFKLEDGYMAFQATPTFSSTKTEKFMKNLASQFVSEIDLGEQFINFKKSIYGQKEFREFVNSHLASKLKSLLNDHELVRKLHGLPRTEDL